MRSLIDPESPVMQTITKIAYSAYLNVLWLVCSLPIVTIGASTTALFYVSLRITRGEEGDLTRDFFRSFRQNFKQATVVWLLLLAVGVALGVDGYVVAHLVYESAFWTILAAALIACTIVYCIVLLYSFPLLARFETGTLALFKSALMMGARYLFNTILMAGIYFAMAYVIVNLFTPAIVLGMGFCALCCSHFLTRIFPLCRAKSEEEEKPQ